MDDRRIAYHEAGHAVALFALGGDLAAVSIAGGEGARGRVHRPTFPAPPAPDGDGAGAARWRAADGREAMTIALLAACRAEERATGSCDSRAAAFDRQQAETYARHRPTPNPAAYLQWAQERAAALISEQWPAVEALAQALLVHREVEGDQARRIVREASAGGSECKKRG
jgi:hypothetical protein